MKKFTSFILAAALGMALLTGCGPEKPAETSAGTQAHQKWLWRRLARTRN